MKTNEGVRHVDDHDGVYRFALSDLQDRRESGQFPPFAVIEVSDHALRGQSGEDLSSDGGRHGGWSALVHESGQRERIHPDELFRTDGGP